MSLKLVAVAVALLLTGCTAKPKPAAELQPPVSSGIAQSIVPGSAKDFSVVVGDTVHFDYAKYDLSAADRSILQRQAVWLQKYSKVEVTIQGNCDERGTREYNLALGSRRANAVRDYLISLGVSSQRIDTISYGKEHPTCAESTETCWAQNRRAVTAITSGAVTS